MKYPKSITKDQIDLLEYEVLSQDFYIRLTRDLLDFCEECLEMDNMIISRKNRLINLSRTISGRNIYVLESDDDGQYINAEHSWHNGMFFLIFRSLNTIQFIEFMFELFKLNLFKIDYINSLLINENASFRFIENGIDVFPFEELDDTISEETHPNIRYLIKRMDNAFNEEDYSLVLLTSATIFETMAKDIIGIDSIQNESLGSFFERFKKDTSIPKEIVEYIIQTYNKRSKEPLSGHGSIKTPTLKKQDAVIIKELTKAFIKIEYSQKINKL